MMENSTKEERDALPSANFGLQTPVGFFATLVGGYLPTLFGNLMGVRVESAPAYGAALGVTVALMNMGNPLYEAFALEQVSQRGRAAVSGPVGMSYYIGWTVGPYLSGYVQAQPHIGFKPIFLLTCSLYVGASILERAFFQRLHDQQRQAAVVT